MKTCWTVHAVLNCLHFSDNGGQDEPDVRMWRGYEQALVMYGLHACDVGGSDMAAQMIANFYNPRREFVLPWWLGSGELHFSHQSQLIKADWKFYRPLFPTAPLWSPMLWPEGVPMKTDDIKKTKCAANPAGHEMQVVRERGSRHRLQCKFCKTMSQWERKQSTDFEQHAANYDRLADAPEFDKMTIPKLKEYAKKYDIKVTSKMTKGELVEAVKRG